MMGQEEYLLDIDQTFEYGAFSTSETEIRENTA